MQNSEACGRMNNIRLFSSQVSVKWVFENSCLRYKAISIYLKRWGIFTSRRMFCIFSDLQLSLTVQPGFTKLFCKMQCLALFMISPNVTNFSHTKHTATYRSWIAIILYICVYICKIYHRSERQMCLKGKCTILLNNICLYSSRYADYLDCTLCFKN